MVRVFGHYIPRKLLVLATAEAGPMFAAFMVGGTLWIFYNQSMRMM